MLACEVMPLTANSSFSLDGRTPMEQVTGVTPDISEYLDFGFYDWVWFKDNAGLGENRIGRWLGVAHRIGNLMSYWILMDAGCVIARTTVQRVTNLEQTTDEVRQRCQHFDQHVTEILKDANHIISHGDDIVLQDWNDFPIKDDPDFVDEFQRIVSDDKISDEDEQFTPDVFDDTYLNMEVTLPRGGGDPDDTQFARVTKRLRDKDDHPIVTANYNPLLDTLEYEVEFLDGHKESLSANLIAQHLFSQVDEEGHNHILLDDIIDFRRNDTAIDKADALWYSEWRKMETIYNSRMAITMSMEGREHQLGGSQRYETFLPGPSGRLCIANKIDDEPAFAWWVAHVFKTRDHILSKIKSKYLECSTHKLGLKIPKTVAQAQAINKENGDKLWWASIVIEMKNVRPAFEWWEKTEGKLPVGYQKIKCHFVSTLKWAKTSGGKHNCLQTVIKLKLHRVSLIPLLFLATLYALLSLLPHSMMFSF
jgi:hypothetical protein